MKQNPQPHRFCSYCNLFCILSIIFMLLSIAFVNLNFFQALISTQSPAVAKESEPNSKHSNEANTKPSSFETKCTIGRGQIPPLNRNQSFFGCLFGSRDRQRETQGERRKCSLICFVSLYLFFQLSFFFEQRTSRIQSIVYQICQILIGFMITMCVLVNLL